MKKKLIVAALSLLLLITFFVQQNTYAAIDTDRETYCTITFSSGYQYDLWMTKRDSHECLGNFETVLFVYPAIDNQTVYAIARYFISSVPDSSSSTVFSWKSNFGSWGSDWSGQGFVMEPELSQNDIKDGQVISLSMSLITRKDGNPEPIIDGYDYLVECDSFDDFTKKREQLTNNDVDFDDIGVIGTKWTENGPTFIKELYDLPNFKLTEYKKNSKDYTFKWNNSEVVKKPYFDILNVETQIQGCFKMAFKKNDLFKPYELRPIELPFEPLREVPAKNCFLSFDYSDIPYCPENDINYQAIFDRMVSLGIAQEDELYRYNSLHHNDTHNKVLNPNMLLRYHYTDEEKGVEHYSKKYTYLVIHDNDIEVYEVSPDDVVTDDKGNTDINPDNKEEILDKNQVDIVDKSDDVTSNPGLFAKIKSFFNDIGQFPKYFSRIFSILPEWCLVYVAFGISLIVGVGVIKALL